MICKYHQKISKLRPFINKYDQKGKNYQGRTDDWKRFEKNNPTIAINVSYVKNINIYTAKIAKHNLNNENQIILLVIPNGKRCHYLVVKKIICIIKRNKGKI